MCGIFRDRSVGPFFIENNLTAQMYEAMLQEQIITALQKIDDQNLDDIYLQQALLLCIVNLCQYLDEIFPDKWIRRRSHTEWPARSPNLNPLDYFFWEYLKSKVYITKSQDIDDLQQRIVHEINLLHNIQIYRNAVSDFYNRLARCQTVQEQQF